MKITGAVQREPKQTHQLWLAVEWSRRTLTKNTESYLGNLKQCSLLVIAPLMCTDGKQKQAKRRQYEPASHFALMVGPIRWRNHTSIRRRPIGLDSLFRDIDATMSMAWTMGNAWVQQSVNAQLWVDAECLWWRNIYMMRSDKCHLSRRPHSMIDWPLSDNATKCGNSKGD